MLKRGDTIKDTLGFMIAVDVVEGIDPESLMDKLGDSISYMEGVGNIDIDYVGTLETIDGVQVSVNETQMVVEGEFEDESRMLNEGGPSKKES